MKIFLTTFTLITMMVFASSTVILAETGKTKISLKPAKAVYGTPFKIAVSGLMPNEVIQMSVISTDTKGVNWESKASFKADLNGYLDLIYITWVLRICSKQMIIKQLDALNLQIEIV